MKEMLVEFYPSFYKSLIKDLSIETYKRLSEDILLIKESKNKNLSILANKVFKIDKKISVINIDDVAKELLKLLNKKKSFALKCIIKGNRVSNTKTLRFRSRDIEVKVGSILESKGYTVDRKNPHKLVYIYLIGKNIFLSVIDNKKAINQIDNKDALNRSQLKLREALEYFNMDISKIKKALDLGASPGGFSKELSSYGVRVTAVDPGALDESLENDKNVTHLRVKAEELDTKEKFDLLVNDMNLHPKESSNILLKLSKSLKKGGICIMTVKCPTKNIIKYINDTISILTSNFTKFKLKHLPHNKREITLKCERR